MASATMQPVQFKDESLTQPWRAWVEEVKKEEPPVDDKKQSNDLDKGSGLCPGGPECPAEPHQLGTTKFCAYPVGFEVETTVAGYGFMETGTSG